MRQDPAQPRGAACGQVSRDDDDDDYDGHDDTHDDNDDDFQGPERVDCPASRRQESPARQVHQVQRVKMIMMMTSLIVRMITKQGMPVDVKDKRQMTAMHHAISGMSSFSVTLDVRHSPCKSQSSGQFSFMSCSHIFGCTNQSICPSPPLVLTAHITHSASMPASDWPMWIT